MEPLRAFYHYYIETPAVVVAAAVQYGARNAATAISQVALKCISVLSQLFKETDPFSTCIGLGSNAIKILKANSIDHASFEPLSVALGTANGVINAKNGVHKIETLLNGSDAASDVPPGHFNGWKVTSRVLYLINDIIGGIKWASSMALVNAEWLKKSCAINLSSFSKNFKGSILLNVDLAQTALRIAASFANVISTIRKVCYFGWGTLKETARTALSLFGDTTRVAAAVLEKIPDSRIKFAGLCVGTCSQGASFASNVIKYC
jgi:hypothetical protein